jgi:hypothetical protein
MKISGHEVACPFPVIQGPQFAGLPMMPKPPTALLIHESVTRSADFSFKVLTKRNLSVQTVISETGDFIQHADLFARAQHAGAARNPIAIGCEVTNPYYEHLLKPGLVWADVIDAPWAHKGRYVLPTPAQAETCSRWIDFATAPGSPVGVPREWPGLSGGFMSMGRVKAPLRRGIVAHCYFAHADGAWLVLYAWLRIVCALGPAAAYAEAKRRATGVRMVDLREMAKGTHG